MEQDVVLYVTTPSLDEAKKIATALLEKKLVACANFSSTTSMYWWEGKISEDAEVVLLLKTKEEMVVKAQQEIELLHPYAIPCIAKFDVSFNEKYAAWMSEQIQNT